VPCTATANFLSGLIKSLPPLHDVAGMAGIELPEYLGKIVTEKTVPKTSQYKPDSNEKGK
jgi:flotillin